MSIIRPADQERLQSRFEQELQGAVRLALFVQPASGLYVPGRQEEPQTGRQAQQLLTEMASLSPKLHLDVYNPRAEPELAARYRIERTPAIVLMPDPAPGGPEGQQQVAGASRPSGETPPAGEPEAAGQQAPTQTFGRGLVRFFGLPAGYEFATLIDDIVDLSRRRTRLSEETRQALATLPGALHLQVFVTPT
ncbi:MAG TPA: hypothetical protein VHS99_08075 [Chloroflexota bacterium]|nr:hypothetical protein [Chloroflexota bacterium]